MTNSSDAYWDELGFAWCAIDPDLGLVTPRLRNRLRRQSRDGKTDRACQILSSEKLLYNIMGCVANDSTIIDFCVSFPNYNSMTAWSGYCSSPKGVPTIHTIWHLVSAKANAP